MHKVSAKTARTPLPLPDKLFYKIGEVSKISGVESYVLRYWETEFPFLRPRKNKSGQRVYVKKDLELILEVKKLLYKERYTIEGVRKKFGDMVVRTSEPLLVCDNRSRMHGTPSEVLDLVKKRLREILNQLA